ncbi:MmcQ/YjbR family DNA-binding protein [Cohnella sp. CFH 77786]|uniref:MmcQ/YjbR family DNA-binding protein n=1 Tax=Cohnella sp. CFH 77786 TaxID=2662265 RepID=UPI001C6109D6|nr:MmcQ/YjbR family DNA-binding protein [Cohnella sp. CFH 77786]MBW5448057.1 MmcQ/YjbR family DNA-binding protein [Cohnella sp. CFH 77786]
MAYESEHVLVSETALAVRDRIREICAGLPEAVEKIDGFGHTTFRVRDKSFVMMSEGEKGWGGNCCIKSDKETQQFLIQKGPYIRAPYIGQHGWVLVENMDIADWDEFRELVIEAYLRTAPKRLVQAYRQD